MVNAIKRAIIVILGVILQFGFHILIQLYFHNNITIIGIIYDILSILIVLKLLKDSTNLSNDLPWIMLILVFPIFGTILLLTLGGSYAKNKLLKNIYNTENEYQKYLKQDNDITKQINDNYLDNLKYLNNYARFPASTNNDVKYYNFGQDFYPSLLKELKSAEKFIFMEYFIINNGIMLENILDILKEKASLGVDVRIIYDDMGSIAMLSTNYPKQLSTYGIKCIPFNKVSPFKGIFMNNRDHRKMTIIDGKVRHDPYMVAESAIKLICNDLKYEDREDDPEYVMLNAKLKSDKRINKIKKMQAKMEKKEQGKQQDKNKKSVRKSKFNSKYSDRIQSIRESDEKFRRNHQK